MKRSQYFVLSFAAMLAVLLFGVTGSANAQAVQRRTISVVGSATEASSPVSVGVGAITLRISAHDATATLAFAKLSDQIRAIRKILVDEGASPVNIIEGEVQMSPSYDYSKAGLPPSITGYQVTKPVTVKVEHEVDLPKFIDAVTQAGVSSVALGGSIEYDDGGTEETDELEHAALADAHERAEQLAKQIGATLGDVVSVSTVENETAAKGGEEEEEERGHRQSATPQKKSLELKVVYALH